MIDSRVEFEFTDENMVKAKSEIKKFPEGREKSAILALLDLAQRQAGGWLPQAAIEYIAKLLNIASIRVYEVASFYSMFNLKPVGENLIQVCRTTPCWLKGSDSITQAIENKLGINLGETTPDKKFTLVEVECLGACVNAPVVQINNEYYEDLDESHIRQILDEIMAGREPKSGSQTNRQCSAPLKKV